MSYTYGCRLKKELIAKGWIQVIERYFIRPLKGFETVGKSVGLDNQSVHLDNLDDIIESVGSDNYSVRSDNQSVEMDTKSVGSDNHNRYITDKSSDKVTDKVEKRTSKLKRASRVPDNFTVTDEMKNWANVKTPDTDIETETEAFLDHFRSVGGSKATKTDWVAAWRNWMRRSKTFGRPALKKNKTYTMEDHDAYWHRKLEEEGNRAHLEQAPINKGLGNGLAGGFGQDGGGLGGGLGFGENSRDGLRGDLQEGNGDYFQDDSGWEESA